MKVRAAPTPTLTARASAYPAPARRRGGRLGGGRDFGRPESGPKRRAPELARNDGEPRRYRCSRHGCGPELGLVPEAGRPSRPEGLHCHGAGEGEGKQRGPLPAGARSSGLILDAAARPSGSLEPRCGLARPPSRKGPALPPSGAAGGGRKPRSRPGTQRARPVAGRRLRVSLPAGDHGVGGRGTGSPRCPASRVGLSASLGSGNQVPGADPVRPQRANSLLRHLVGADSLPAARGPLAWRAPPT